ncbi:SMI1/KNR4 family protein [Streptomyces sp. NBC_01304]|uniref:SMI1/KNR4 family protein n=1 Tax=Streptomyces sp. NBC_01304 TaxID=2903818 RepID=UPI002E14DBA1|nr:SMI1/KNR4 family protein [Streptomyces sp. NBC_01304]
MDDETRHGLMEAQRAAVEARQVTDAWQRIEAWLGQHAPGTLAALRPGARDAEVTALVQDRIGVRIPPGLRALWAEHAGVHDVPWASFMLGDRALMDFEAVVSKYEMMRDLQRRDGDEEHPFWRAAWIPFCSAGAHDTASGLYLDAETGRICHWDMYGERTPRYESLTTYLEEMADRLEAPTLVGGDKPGLLDLRALAWGPPVDAERAALWEPFTGRDMPSRRPGRE